jgi:hypothetical protein
MDDMPPYLVASPVGFHVTELLDLFRSPHKAPVSSDPDRRGWATEATTMELSQLFPSTPIGIATLNILVYNKSRDRDRICLACRRWYRVGEAPAHDADKGGAWTFKSFDEFVTRPLLAAPPDVENDEVVREQDLSGICSRVCLAVNSAEDDETTPDLDQVTPEQISPHSAVDHASGWSIRQTTEQEEQTMGGVKLVWEKRD